MAFLHRLHPQCSPSYSSPSSSTQSPANYLIIVFFATVIVVIICRVVVLSRIVLCSSSFFLQAIPLSSIIHCCHQPYLPPEINGWLLCRLFSFVCYVAAVLFPRHPPSWCDRRCFHCRPPCPFADHLQQLHSHCQPLLAFATLINGWLLRPL